MSHPSVIREYKGEQISIDALIAPLIDLLWDEDFSTIECCQGGEGSSCNEELEFPATVTFTTNEEAIEFYYLLRRRFSTMLLLKSDDDYGQVSFDTEDIAEVTAFIRSHFASTKGASESE